MDVYVVAYLIDTDGDKYYEWSVFTDFHKAQDYKRTVTASLDNVVHVEVYTLDVFDVVADEIERKAPWVQDARMKH